MNGHWLSRIIVGFSATLVIFGGVIVARPALAAGAFGINTRVPEFVDAMKEVRDWSAIPGGPDPTRDSNGWPTSDANIVIYDGRTNMFWNGPDPLGVPPDDSGTYHMTFNGQATLIPDIIDGGVAFTVTNQIYDTSTNTTNADIVVPAGGVDLLVIEFTDTHSTNASSANTGVTNVTLTRPGYTGSTQTFTTRYTNLLAPFDAIRFMDAMNTNDYPWLVLGTTNTLTSTPWSLRRLSTDSSQTDAYNGKRGMAWEYAVQLANETGKDMWINIPVNATDGYVTQLASLIHGSLHPGLHVYVEYSNEVWNGAFQQAVWNTLMATQDAATPSSTLNNPATSDPNVLAQRRYARRTMEISNIFRNEFGASAMMTTVRPVMGWQEQDVNYYDTTMQWIELNYGAPKNFYYGFGNANYFNATDYTSVANCLNSLTTAANANYSVEAGYSAIAAFYGVANVAYEGGATVEDGSSNAANGLAASRDSSMEGIISNSYLNDWYAAGGQLACYYELYATYSPSGQWGLLEGDLSKTSTPKYLGAKDVHNAPQPAVTAGIATSTTVGSSVTWPAPNSSYHVGSNSVVIAGDGSKYLWGSDTGSYYDYLLNVPQSGTYALILNVGGNQTDGQVTYIVDDQVLATAVAVPNTNGGETWANMSPISVTLSAGLHDFRVKVANGIPAGHLSEWGLHNIIVQTLSLASSSGGTPVLQINCGGSAISGTSWVADTDFYAGFGYNAGGTIDTSGVTNPAPQEVYQNGHYVNAGMDFTYTLPGFTASAPYTVRLHFNAFFDGMVDNVTINGTQVLTNFNVATAAGGANIAVVKTFTTNADSSGNITILFANPGTGSYATVQGIEVLTGGGGGSPPPAPSGLGAVPGNAQATLTWTASSGATGYNIYRGASAGGETLFASPAGTSTAFTDTSLTNGTTYYYQVTALGAGGESVKSNEASATPSGGGIPVLQINCGGSAVSGTSWVADTDVSGGFGYNAGGTIDTSGVTNPAPQEVYQNGHYINAGMNFTYTLPGFTANAPYTVRLHFNAFFDGMVDNVTINGTQVLTSFDVAAAAGGANIAIVKTFTTNADSSGNITIDFANPGIGSYATVQGIEVLH